MKKAHRCAGLRAGAPSFVQRLRDPVFAPAGGGRRIVRHANACADGSTGRNARNRRPRPPQSRRRPHRPRPTRRPPYRAALGSPIRKAAASSTSSSLNFSADGTMSYMAGWYLSEIAYQGAGTYSADGARITYTLERQLRAGTDERLRRLQPAGRPAHAFRLRGRRAHLTCWSPEALTFAVEGSAQDAARALMEKRRITRREILCLLILLALAAALYLHRPPAPDRRHGRNRAGRQNAAPHRLCLPLGDGNALRRGIPSLRWVPKARALSRAPARIRSACAQGCAAGRAIPPCACPSASASASPETAAPTL